MNLGNRSRPLKPVLYNLERYFDEYKILRVDYAGAEMEAQHLASLLIDRFGQTEIQSFAFAPIPRGGLFPLGMLSYALGLSGDALQPAPDAKRPLVVVDDCAYSGLRFHEYLQATHATTIVFAHLFSVPALRQAITDAEPRVPDCIAARDLADLTPTTTSERHGEWQRSWQHRLEGHRYWLGIPQLVLFPWSEPQIPYWRNGRVTRYPWRFASPDACLKNKSELALPPRRSRPEYRVPERVAFSASDSQIFLCDGDSIYTLTGFSAQVWRALAVYGERRLTVEHVGEQYDADLDMVRGDVNELIEQLLAQGLLEYAQ